ncbi:hypothetical protein N7468_000856 [Penicillium chermesinum]|uniref:Uncharacterized protein n=1 Tax=Penicillium chermesinum TaxID=63820 RepID=A0A9W9TWT5_9EURO|nr:uncharacterized protein N7468_000856 [Penicillium chermesinum]KAJ5245873.1 hypothetical protein N7468_000856 [Penicillium chermesinum]KAJ6144172.1 hypothetical protein N7470_008067 [Penicillium chermesinum]
MMSWKEPLGMSDSRLTMTSSFEDRGLSPSYASILEYCDCEISDLLPLDETDTRSPRNLTLNQRCPRLELDPTMDNFYTLDGLAEQQNPQNTPTTDSYAASPERRKTQPLAQSDRSPNAPHLDLDWLDRSLLTHPILTRSQTEMDPLSLHTQSAKGVTHSILRSGSPTREYSLDMPVTRTVRFSPPPSPKRPRPSVERKRDYIVSHRQSRQHAKWKSVRRRQSAVQAPKLKGINESKGRGTHLPLLSKVPLPYPMCAGPGTSHSQAKGGTTAAAQQETRQALKQPSVYDMIVINFGVYGPRYPEHLGPNSQWAFMRIKMNPTFISARDLRSQPEETKQIVCRLPAENILFHFVFVVPAFIVRRPHAFISFVRRLANSTLGLNAFTLLKIFFFGIASLVNLIAQLVWDMELGFQVNIHRRFSDRFSDRRRQVSR